jgi:hypothetical protein
MCISPATMRIAGCVFQVIAILSGLTIVILYTTTSTSQFAGTDRPIKHCYQEQSCLQHVWTGALLEWSTRTTRGDTRLNQCCGSAADEAGDWFRTKSFDSDISSCVSLGVWPPWDICKRTWADNKTVAVSRSLAWIDGIWWVSDADNVHKRPYASVAESNRYVLALQRPDAKWLAYRQFDPWLHRFIDTQYIPLARNNNTVASSLLAWELLWTVDAMDTYQPVCVTARGPRPYSRASAGHAEFVHRMCWHEGSRVTHELGQINDPFGVPYVLWPVAGRVSARSVDTHRYAVWNQIQAASPLAVSALVVEQDQYGSPVRTTNVDMAAVYRVIRTSRTSNWPVYSIPGSTWRTVVIDISDL